MYSASRFFRLLIGGNARSVAGKRRSFGLRKHRFERYASHGASSHGNVLGDLRSTAVEFQFLLSSVYSALSVPLLPIS